MTDSGRSCPLAFPKADSADKNGQEKPELKNGEPSVIGIPTSAKEQSKNAPTYASFGDKRTTASVNSSSVIMQITQFLGLGTSGFYTVERATTEEPYLIQQRAQSLAKQCEYAEGITWYSDDQDNAPSKLQFVQDRWPRFTPINGGPKVVADYFVSKGTVFEQKTWSTDEGAVPIVSNKKPWRLPLGLYKIRQLDFISSTSHLIEASNYESHLTSDGKSVLWFDKSLKVVNPENKSSHYVCFIAATFVDGRVRKMKKVKVEQTSSSDDKSGNTYQIALDDEETFYAKRGQPLKTIVAFRLQLIPEGEDFEKSKIGIDDSAFCSVISQKILETSYRKLRFAEKSEKGDCLDFMIRRNLEHILSVCSIPVPVMPGDVKGAMEDGQPKDREEGITPIALTCGDISGHRVITSASL